MISIFLLVATVSDDYGKREAEVQSFTTLSPALPCCEPTPHDSFDKKVAPTVTAIVHFWLGNNFLCLAFRAEYFIILFHTVWVWLSILNVLLANFLFKKVTSEPGYQPLWTCLPLDNCHLVYNKTTVHYRPIWSQLLHPSNPPSPPQKKIECIISKFWI